MTDQLLPVPIRVFDENGAPVPGARMESYAAGTSTPVTLVDDSGDNLAWPVVADAQGVFPQVYPPDANFVKIIVTTSGGAVLNGYPIDPAFQAPATGGGASGIAFAPISGNAATDVQAAIENNTNLWNSVSTYGRSLVAALNATAARLVLGLGDIATTNLLDEDDMSSDAAGQAPSQQSVKAYVDNQNHLKAWGVFNGIGAPALIAGSNVASITDNGTGDYTITFTDAMPSANYVVILSCSGNRDATIQNGNRVIANVRTDGSGLTEKTTTAFRMTTVIGAVGVFADVDEIYFQILA